ncbi:MAG: hypothetical protein RBR48_01640 [Bacilli bacterium]|jgi:hypothetical protein|nr:hypothetical protein [Bacilli bacterium]MDY0208870.1 hypothetical protein [Bacilli bacterium]
MSKLFKRFMAVALVVVLAFVFVGCGKDKKADLNDGGAVFHIYAWNTEFQGFFNKYVSDEKKNDPSIETYHLDGVPVKWTITTSDNGAYQNALDMALRENETANEDNKVDMFLAEADYILKYVNTSLTKDIETIGVDDFSEAYQYTIDIGTDRTNVIKAASFQCCPAGMVYRRSIAQEVLGKSEPADVQPLVDSWAKFEAVAAQMKAKGYYMTGSYADTYRVFSNNADKAWVDENKNIQIPTPVNTWMTQAEKFVKEGYTKTEGVWDGGKTIEFAEGGKVFCTFGPAWYYNFCMGTAMGTGDNHEGGTYGDWALIAGPQAYFWGGTWLLCPSAGSNDSLVSKTMNAFLNDEEVIEKLVKEDSQFSNNKKVNAKVAADYETEGKGNGLLKGQNDTKVWVEMADSIQVKYSTIYDQQCNEGLQTAFVKFLKNDEEINTKAKALADFFADLQKAFPNLVVPK